MSLSPPTLFVPPPCSLCHRTLHPCDHFSRGSAHFGLVVDHSRLLQNALSSRGRRSIRVIQRPALSEADLQKRVLESDFDWAFYFRTDPNRVLVISLFLLVAVPLLTRLSIANSKREERLRASIRVKGLKEKAEETPGDVQVVRVLREEENLAKSLQTEEDDLREISLLGRRVVQFGLLDTNEIQRLKCELAGVPAPQETRDVFTDFTFLALITVLGFYFFLTLLRDPVTDLPR